MGQPTTVAHPGLRLHDHDMGNIVYSATPAQSSVVTSNDVFVVNWTWDAVAGAEGYRLL